MSIQPENGKWYWVRMEDCWFPALSDMNAAGGWTNWDTWEDFRREVEEWIEINIPDKIITNSKYYITGDRLKEEK